MVKMKRISLERVTHYREWGTLRQEF